MYSLKSHNTYSHGSFTYHLSFYKKMVLPIYGNSFLNTFEHLKHFIGESFNLNLELSFMRLIIKVNSNKSSMIASFSVDSLKIALIYDSHMAWNVFRPFGIL